MLWCALALAIESLGLCERLRDADGDCERLALRLRLALAASRPAVERLGEDADCEKQAADERCVMESDMDIESGVARSQKPLVSLDTSDWRRFESPPLAAALLFAARLLRLRLRFMLAAAAARMAAGRSTR